MSADNVTPIRPGYDQFSARNLRSIARVLAEINGVRDACFRGEISSEDAEQRLLAMLAALKSAAPSTEAGAGD